MNPIDIHPIVDERLNQEQWEYSIKTMMRHGGWELDIDTETKLGFFYIEGEFHWIRDYNKKSRTFIQYNGNQKINLISSKKIDESN